MRSRARPRHRPARGPAPRSAVSRAPSRLGRGRPRSSPGAARRGPGSSHCPAPAAGRFRRSAPRPHRPRDAAKARLPGRWDGSPTGSLSSGSSSGAVRRLGVEFPFDLVQGERRARLHLRPSARRRQRGADDRSRRRSARRRAGHEAARLAGLSIFASLAAVLGDLDRVGGWVKALGLVQCAPGSTSRRP